MTDEDMSDKIDDLIKELNDLQEAFYRHLFCGTNKCREELPYDLRRWLARYEQSRCKDVKDETV